MVYNIEDLVREIFFQICLAIQFSEIMVAVTVKAYVDRVDHATILSHIMAACLPCLSSLLTGLTNGFAGLE